MSLSQIQYFVAVAEAGSVGRAAARLHISQPPLSRQIQNLEQELGAPLFRRTSRGMALLPAGQLFLRRCRNALAELDVAVAEVQSGAGSGGPPRPSGSRLA